MKEKDISMRQGFTSVGGGHLLLVLWDNDFISLVKTIALFSTYSTGNKKSFRYFMDITKGQIPNGGHWGGNQHLMAQSRFILYMKACYYL